MTTLRLDDCPCLSYPPKDMHGDIEKMKRCLASVKAILDGALALEDAGADERKFFFRQVLKAVLRRPPRRARPRGNPASRRMDQRQGPFAC